MDIRAAEISSILKNQIANFGTEAEVAAAMRLAFERLHLVVEPGGAVALAAVLSGKVELGAVPLVTLSGGNVDAAAYAAIIAGI